MKTAFKFKDLLYWYIIEFEDLANTLLSTWDLAKVTNDLKLMNEKGIIYIWGVISDL